MARKRASDIIHAEGVRVAVPSSAPQVRNVLSSREDIRALGKTINLRSAAGPGSRMTCPPARTALSGGKRLLTRSWCWITFGEQSMVISRERRSTRGFNGKIWLDQTGKPTSDALHVTERFRRTDFGHMEIQSTIDDPKVYTKPWQVKEQVRLMPDSDIFESACENNRDIEHLRGKFK